MSFYSSCDLPGDASNAIRSVNDDISSLIKEIESDFDSSSNDYDITKDKLNTLLAELNNLLLNASNVDLRGLIAFIDSLGLQTPNATRDDDEKRLSLVNLAVLNGTALLSCSGTNVEDTRTLVKLLGIDEAEKLLTQAKPGDKYVLITKPYQIIVEPVNQKSPTVDYINATYKLNIKAEDVTWISEGRSVDYIDIPQDKPAKAVVDQEYFIGKNISLLQAAKIANTTVDQLNVYVFVIYGSSNSYDNKAVFTTKGFNSKGFSNLAYNLKIKLNNSDVYLIDVTGNKGISINYTAATVASVISWQIPGLQVQAVGEELVFKTNKVGATASIEFLNPDDNDASYVCGVISSLKQLVDSYANVDTSNIKFGSSTEYMFSNSFSGAKTTLKQTNPTKISDLPTVLIKGGNAEYTTKITRNDILWLTSLGLSKDQISAISSDISLAEENSSLVTDSTSDSLEIFNLILKELSDIKTYQQAIKVISNVANLAQNAILAFNPAVSANNFKVISIKDTKLFSYLRDYVEMPDSDIEKLFYERDDIQCVDTSATDADVIDRIHSLLPIQAGSTAMSTKALNISVNSNKLNKILIDQTKAQLSTFKNDVDRIYLQIKSTRDFNIVKNRLNDLNNEASHVQNSLSEFNDVYMSNMNVVQDNIPGFTSYDTPGSLLLRTVNPAKTFRMRRETLDIINASESLVISEGTNTLISSIATLVDSAISQFSILNNKVQGSLRGWINPLEASAGVMGNLSGNGFFVNATANCAFAASSLDDLNVSYSSCLAAYYDSLTSIEKAVVSLLDVFHKIFDQLMCKINSLIEKIDIPTNKLPFHCDVNLKISLDPAIFSLISKVNMKIRAILNILRAGMNHLRSLSLAFPSMGANLESYRISSSKCGSDAITQYFGPNGEITNLAQDALESFGTVFDPIKSIKTKFSISQPPKDLANQLQKPEIQDPKIPKI